MSGTNEERRNAMQAVRIDERENEAAIAAANMDEADPQGDDMDMELRPVTVRFTRSAWEAIRDIAAENGVSQAELVRMAVAGNLSAYLGTVRILDREQAADVKSAILSLLGMLSKIENELHRLGVNYNQQVRLMNIEKKKEEFNKKKKESSSGRAFGHYNWNLDDDEDTEQVDQYEAEKQKVMDECMEFTRQDVEALIARYETATAKVGDILCRILA